MEAGGGSAGSARAGALGSPRWLGWVLGTGLAIKVAVLAFNLVGDGWGRSISWPPARP